MLYECLPLCVPVTPVLSAAAREMDPCSNTTMSEMQLNSADEIQPVHILKSHSDCIDERNAKRIGFL